MFRPLPRRSVLHSLALLPAALALGACSDSGGDQPPAAAAEPATPPPATVEAPPSQGSVDMTELLKPGALPDLQLGNADAPVTIVEYASMTCPHCARFHAVTLPEIKTRYIDTGKVRLILREFPFDPRAEAGFMLARCSGDNYYAMVDVLFRQQMSWAAVENSRDPLLQIAKLAGFSQESFEACLRDQALLDNVRAVQRRGASEFNVDSTPTFFINGQTYKGAMTLEEMSAVIDSMV